MQKGIGLSKQHLILYLVFYIILLHFGTWYVFSDVFALLEKCYVSEERVLTVSMMYWESGPYSVVEEPMLFILPLETFPGSHL